VPETTLTLEEAVDACADIAAVLHASGIEAGSSRTFDDELWALHPTISSMRRISPVLGERLAEWIGQLGADAASSSPLPAVFSHGDYTPAQVVFDGTESGLLDLDTLCRAEAALDLGRFSAYLRVICRKAEREWSSPYALGTELAQRFLQSYLDAAGTPPEEERLLARVSAYEAVSLVRMAVHSWQQLKPVRTADVLSVLEERASLPTRPR
jgi:aminoglycoside phosphotransferase (APT) family kinase protein